LEQWLRIKMIVAQVQVVGLTVLQTEQQSYLICAEDNYVRLYMHQAMSIAYLLLIAQML
jgi:hypothetical protein